MASTGALQQPSFVSQQPFVQQGSFGGAYTTQQPTTFTGVVFEVCPDGLHWMQWVISILIGLTVIFINFFIKFLPDRITPAIGRDRVFDAREKEAGRKPEPKFADK